MDVLSGMEMSQIYGFVKIADNDPRTGYLLNMESVEIVDKKMSTSSALDLYFIGMDGSRFKHTISYFPYFFICVEEQRLPEASQFLKTKFVFDIVDMKKIVKEDLDLANHLSGLKKTCLKIEFFTQNSLTKVRRFLMSAIKKKIDRKNYKNHNNTSDDQKLSVNNRKEKEVTDFILDIREHDLPYHIRVSIDLKIFCGMWYNIQINDNSLLCPTIKARPDILERPEPVVLAFDIETTKLPLKFPDPQIDQIIMISYVLDGQGYLITNREIITSDVSNFEFTPKQEFEGHFIVFNETNEMMTIQRFFQHIIKVRPNIFVTYNGDYFDWPFIEVRASLYGLDMGTQIGVSRSRDNIYLCSSTVHMDCLYWVKRDSYLPVGSHGLKAVAKSKLCYDPIELDPEEICKMATQQPQTLSNYSVSDAIATYYLYMKYVHTFIFALSTIIPMKPDEILRKGSGTLCETLLMVKAHHANILYPNKQEDMTNKLSQNGQLIDSETYIGGHVEALDCGVYRADIPCRFRLDRDVIKQLLHNVDIVLENAISKEEGVELRSVTNIEEVSNEIKSSLKGLYDIPNRLEQPVIYHLDVGAMYPNIILTNRLQPSAIVSDTNCAACDFNISNAVCKRVMKWHWRGEVLPASKSELQRIKQQLELEKFPPLQIGKNQRAFHELSQEDQISYEKKRISDYCRSVYKKNKVVKIEQRTSIICQKENSFYVDTVRAFRDRRYEYKKLTKVAKQAVIEAVKKGDVSEIKAAKNKEVLYDSLQLAHKCILNSFYGYVMRKGARWHSMPMAGIVCSTGSKIIMKARKIIERIGRPLELDTDGIWCILPASFPQVFTIHSSQQGKTTFNISYPNAVLNNMVREDFTNDQYHELINTSQTGILPKYEIRSENSIFFEVDGPYLAMVLPAAKEEGRKLKKRYAVFNFDGSIAELKGFEVKRRGELQIIKNFQSSVFKSFLSGNTLQECYNNVSKIANYWLDVLFSHGQHLPDYELFDLISENRSMSKKLEDYGNQKSTAITTAKRLAEFLGDQILKNPGLSCRYVISKKPLGSPITDRAIPLAIFQCAQDIQTFFLRKWLRDSSFENQDIRDLLDWKYYIERLTGAIQKIITIPAALQGLNNPVPRVQHPDWLHTKIKGTSDKTRQRQITELFCAKVYNPLMKENTDHTSTKEICPEPILLGETRFKRTYSNSDSPKELRTQSLIVRTKFDLSRWVLIQKRKWRNQLIKKQNCIKRPCSDTHKSYIKSKSISGFLNQSKQTILHRLWEVICITDTNKLGNFVVWAIIENELHKIRLQIPRFVYANQKTLALNFQMNVPRKKVNSALPRSIQAYNLFMYKLNEENCMQNGFGVIKNIPVTDIEGLYETKIPLITRFLIEIGCLCSIWQNKEKAVRTLNETRGLYSFEHLEKRTGTHIYLRKSWNKIKKIYLYQHTFSEYRQIWGLIFPSCEKIILVFLDKIRTNKISNIELLYNAERVAYLNRAKNKETIPSLKDNMEVDVFVEVDITQVYKHIQRGLKAYKEKRKGPTLLCTQTLIDIAKFKSAMLSLSDYPLLQIHVADCPSTSSDLNWQTRMTRQMIRHFFNINNVLSLMLEQSRYLGIPIGNLPPDTILMGTDLFYARLLKKNNYILWWSRNTRPDLGGKEIDDNHMSYDVINQHYIHWNMPGIYNGICVSLAIQDLIICAILQSKTIENWENGGCTTFDTNIAANLEYMLTKSNKKKYISGEIILCTPALRILRIMVKKLLHEVSLNQSIFAEYHISNIYRWVQTDSSFLYDPLIAKAITNLMEKVLFKLISELKTLGAVVVFADFKRIIINSKKKTVLDALNYTDFIVQSIRKQEVFTNIELTFEHIWNNLVWIDSHNFVGEKCNLPIFANYNAILNSSVSTSVDIYFNPESDTLLESKYIKFKELIFMLLKSMITNQLAHLALQNIFSSIYEFLLDVQNKSYDNDIAFLKCMQLLLKIMDICDCSDEIIILKKKIMELIKCSQITKDIIEFKNSSVNGVTCRTCSEYRDFDIINNKQEVAKNGRQTWLCHRCLVAYETGEIETLIIKSTMAKMMSYTLQDTKCLRCNKIKKDNFSSTCSCSNNYKPCDKIRGRDLILFLTLSETYRNKLIHFTISKILKLYHDV